MTQTQAKALKSNIFNGFSLANMLLLLGLLVSQSKWQQKTDDNISTLSKDLMEHKTDESVHMPLRVKMDVFVPRNELQVELEGIKADLKEIKDLLK